MGPQLSWLERTTDNREVGGSSPLGPTTYFLLSKESKQRKLQAWIEAFCENEMFQSGLERDRSICTLKTEQ